MGSNTTSNQYDSFYTLNSEILATYAGALAVALPLVTLLVKLFFRTRVVVNCWFCNTNSKVSSANVNRWCCPNCEQYNGFLPNGDYNKDIPEQRQGTSRTFTTLSRSKASLESNGLCDRCNANQEMKVRLLAAFQPTLPSNFEEELSIYSNQLEVAYRLCQNCEAVLQETLEQKKSLVLGMQLQQSDKRIKGRSKVFDGSFGGVFRGITTAVAVALCALTSTATPLLKSADLPTLSWLGKEVEANYWAVLAANFAIQLVLTLCTARKLPLVVCGAHLGLYFWEEQWSSVEDYSYALSFLSGLTLILTLCSNKTRKSAFVTVKKINKSTSKPKLVERERPLTAAETATPVVRPVVVKPSVKPLIKLEERVQPARMRMEDTEKELAKSAGSQDDTSSVDSAFSNHDSVTQDGDSVRGDPVLGRRGDVDSLVQSLSEWNSGVEEPRRPRTPASRHEFQSRQYKPVLNPPRLVSTSPKSTSPRSLNESSWVAGGFWQNHEAETALRPPSRPPSPNTSFYSTASSSWRSSTPPPPPSVFEPVRPTTPTPTHYPMFVPYSPPNGFQQPFGYPPYVYPTMNPMWNPSLFQGMTPSATTPSSAASCSSASTCASVRRRHFSEDPDVTSPPSTPRKHSGFLDALAHNSSVILYTSVFYVAISGLAFCLYRYV